VNESDWIELRCPATAHPPPERRWSWEAVRIDPSTPGGSGDRAISEKTKPTSGEAQQLDQVLHMDLPKNGSLVIRKVTPAHTGAYECHVSNMAGDDRIQYSLKANN
jgi:hypothetical protein